MGTLEGPCVPMGTLEGPCPQRKVMSSLLQRVLTHSELPTRRGLSQPSLSSALGPALCCHREHLFLRLNEDTRRCCDSKNKHEEISPKAWVPHPSVWQEARRASGQARGGTEQVGRSNRARGTTRAAWGMGYSLIFCLDFGVKACNQRSVNSRTARL